MRGQPTVQRPILTREQGPIRRVLELERSLEQRDRELAACTERMRSAERRALVGTLATGIAHEINNPLGVIILAATNALEVSGEPDAEEVRNRALEKILNHCERCRKIISTVRAFTTNEPAAKTHCSLSQIMRSAVDLTTGYAKDRGISFELELTDQLPQIEMALPEIVQVFVFFLRGAIEAGDRGGRIWIRSEMSDRDLRGIIRERRSGLAAHSDLREIEDNKPGFEIARDIVSAYGGSIDIEVDGGCYTTTIVNLPFRPSPKADL